MYESIREMVHALSSAQAIDLVEKIDTGELSRMDDDVLAFFHVVVIGEKECSFIAKLISKQFSLQYDVVEKFMRDMYIEGGKILKNME